VQSDYVLDDNDGDNDDGDGASSAGYGGGYGGGGGAAAAGKKPKKPCSSRDRLAEHVKWVDRLVSCRDKLFAELRACDDDSVESHDGTNSNIRQTLQQVSGL
jgi:hypothetical protein